MSLVLLRKLSVGITVSAMVLSMQAASAMAAPKGQGAPEIKSGPVEKSHVETQDAEHEDSQESTECVAPAPAPTPEPAPAPAPAPTDATGTTSGTTTATTDPAATATDPAATTGTTVTTTTDATATTPAPSTSCTPKPQANVNLTGHGKAVEHNPNVDANGQLQPGTAAQKPESAPADQQATATAQSTEQAKAEQVAKVKEDSRAKAKAERANGEKGAYLIYVNGEKMNLTPVAKGGRTLVPFRRLAEFLGADVQWDQATKTVTMTKDGHTVVFAIGSTTATVDGQSVEMPVPAELVNSSTVVPLRFIATALGADVDYDQTTSAITVITTPSGGTTDPGTGSTTPSTGTTDPAAGSTTPSTGTTDPAAGSTTPSTGTTDTSSGSTAPSTGTTAPSTGTTDTSTSTGTTAPAPTTTSGN